MSKITKAALFEETKKRSDELVQLVSELIKIPSENPIGSQRKVIDYVEQYLTKAGIAYEEVAVNEKFPCVLAQIGKKDGYSIILNGHVDVVPAGDREQWDFDPFCGTITETQILGRGTSDMKAGVAGILFAMKLLVESGATLNGNVRLHIVSDEESGSAYGTNFLCNNGYADGADACIIAEPTSKTIEIGQKGGLILTFKSYGKSAHGSLGGFKGDNAITKLGKVFEHIPMLTQIKGHYKPSLQHALSNSKRIAEMELQEPGVGEVIDHVSANVGTIQGGTRPNMVPDYCEAVVDLRLPIGVSHDEIVETIEAILKKSGVTGVEYDLEWKSEANYTEEEDPLVQAVKKHAEELWQREIIPGYQWASSDARDYRKLGISTIQYGPSNTEGIHSYNENVDIEDVIKAGQVYVLTLCDLLGIK